MKLQKSLYYLYATYLQETGRPLFAERFMRAENGPVLQDVAIAYEQLSGGPALASDNGQAVDRGKPIQAFMLDTSGKKQYVMKASDPDYRRIFEKVWNRVKYYTGSELSERTHLGGAWRNADEGCILQDDDIMNDHTMPEQRDAPVSYSFPPERFRDKFIRSLASLIGARLT
ncbi:MAG: SocA family protein [Oscillospiraceae bacterium]|jgi:uncharacterized phage-associated protein|nr:SocA family protein [Oscillospiraceae bacterium]